MREIRIYQAGSYSKGESLTLTPQAAHHVTTVLRMQVGQKLSLFCGDNREFHASIEVVDKKKVVVSIVAETFVSRESPRELHLAQAISKGERMEWVMQKAVELGVHSIRPLISLRSSLKLDAERLEKKMAQWKAIAIAACEQCGRNQLPFILPLLTVEDYLKNKQNALKLILYPQANKTWRDYNFDLPAINLMIGPEGGFSDEEIQSALAADFSPLSLGPRILRTETAAITAISVLQAVSGDL